MTMQEIAKKYPWLWEHIAKGGMVKGHCEDCTRIGYINKIDFYDPLPFRVMNEWFDEIEQIPLQKRVPTKDLGKAVNYFNGTNGWYLEDNYFCNENLDESFNMNYLYDVVVNRRTPSDWWPEELMEDENND